LEVGVSIVSDLQVGDGVSGLDILVERCSTAVAKNGKTYLRMTGRDGSGSIEGVCWGYDPSFGVKEGEVISVYGKVDSYNGVKQLNIDNVQKSLKSPDSFARWTHLDVEKIWGDIVSVIGGFTEPLTKFVAEELLLHQSAMVEAFKRAPAAKSVHNNWYGGLLEHVWSLCQLAEFIVPHYQRTYNLPEISKDKVMFGLMLHDAGKVVEYDYRNPAFKLTAIGHFTNHMVLGPAWVYEAANKWPGRTTMDAAKFKLERAHLMHVLAAHHGQVIWGSPVVPASIEAIIVHHCDNLDAKVLHAIDFVKNKPGDIEGFSEQSYIERARFYNYKV